MATLILRINVWIIKTTIYSDPECSVFLSPVFDWLSGGNGTQSHYRETHSWKAHLVIGFVRIDEVYVSWEQFDLNHLHHFVKFLDSVAFWKAQPFNFKVDLTIFVNL